MLFFYHKYSFTLDFYTHATMTLIKINIKVEKMYLPMAGPLQPFLSFGHDPVIDPRKSLISHLVLVLKHHHWLLLPPRQSLLDLEPHHSLTKASLSTLIVHFRPTETLCFGQTVLPGSPQSVGPPLAFAHGALPFPPKFLLIFSLETRHHHLA